MPAKKTRPRKIHAPGCGGMRNPAVAVSRLQQVKMVGEMIHSAWSDFAAEHPRVLEAAQQYGSNEAKLDQTLISLWTERLESLLEMTTSDGVTLKEAVEFKSPLHADLWDAWRVKARDPEQCIGQWAREGAPLGMDVEVQPSDIFPSVESEEPLETRMDLSDLTELRNYESMETQKDEAMVEQHRYLEKGFVQNPPAGDGAPEVSFWESVKTGDDTEADRRRTAAQRGAS